MSASSLDASAINNLSEKEKEELRQFVNTQTQRTRVQARTFSPCAIVLELRSNICSSLTPRCLETHNLTELCWKKCVTSPVKSNTLDKAEESCMSNCVERFLDLNILTAKLLSNMQQQH